MVGVAITWTTEARAMEIGKLLRTGGYAPAPNVLTYANAVDVVTHEAGKPFAIDWCLQEQAAGRAVLIPTSMYQGKLPKPGYPSSLISVPPERVGDATKSGLFVRLPDASVKAATSTGDDGTVGELTPEEARLLTPAWADTDFVQLIEVCKDIRCKPEDLLLVLCSESNLRPDARNPKDMKVQWPFAVGLNQLTFDALVMLGRFKPDQRGEWPPVAQQILDTPVGAQLEMVRQYFNATPWGRDGHEWTSAAKLYQANAAPSTLYTGESMDSVIYPEGSKSYDLNKGLDVNGDGKVTLGDLANAVNYYKGTPLYKAAIVRLNDARARFGLSSSSTSGVSYNAARHAKMLVLQHAHRMPWLRSVSIRPTVGGHALAIATAPGYELHLPVVQGVPVVSARAPARAQVPRHEPREMWVLMRDGSCVPVPLE